MSHDIICSDDHISWVKPCANCHAEMERYIGEEYVYCPECGALHNAFGQRLVDDTLGNPSMYEDDIGDLEGYELQHTDY